MFLKYILLLIFACGLSTSAFARDFDLEKSEFKNFPNSLNGRDFFVKQSVPGRRKNMKPFKFDAPQDCRAHIAKVICLVDPATEEQAPETRVCLDGGQAYAATFEELYDNYPPILQKAFCSLKYLFIEKDFFGTAYAGLLKNADGVTDGAMMGIRKSVIDEKLDLNTWATWKEQLSFGGVLDSYTLTADLPHITSHSKTNTNDFLYFVIAHEFGHILDFANNLNKTESCTEPQDKNEDPVCTMAEDGWGGFSWITDLEAKDENEFLNRTRLCFYWCKDVTLAKEAAPQVYADIDNTNFISIYATTQPWDDFADSLAYFLMYKNLSSTYLISTHQGMTYDIMKRLQSPMFAKKLNYLENFLQRTDLVYP